MINYKYILAATTALLLPAVVKAENCKALPSCTALGFKQSASECVDDRMLKCPFDNSKVFCADSCTTGEGYFDGACHKIYTSCDDIGYIEESEVRNSDCTQPDETIYLSDGTTLSCYLPSCDSDTTGTEETSSSSGTSGGGTGGNNNGECSLWSGCGGIELDIDALPKNLFNFGFSNHAALSLDNISIEECKEQYNQNLVQLDDDFIIYEDSAIL